MSWIHKEYTIVKNEGRFRVYDVGYFGEDGGKEYVLLRDCYDHDVAERFVAGLNVEKEMVKRVKGNER